MTRLAAISLSIWIWSAAPGAAGEPVDSSKYASSTLVVYNKNVDESRTLAAYYAEKRSIPLDNIIGLDCPAAEEISRQLHMPREQINDIVKRPTAKSNSLRLEA